MSQTTVEDIWKDDRLERMAEAQTLQTFLDAIIDDPSAALDRASFVMNLKGQWGSGKSFFLKKFAEQQRLRGHFVVELDAWKADPDIDPLVTLVAAIKVQIEKKFGSNKDLAPLLDSVKRYGATITWKFAKGVARRLSAKVAGDAVDDIGDFLIDADFTDDQADKTISDAKDIVKTSSDEALASNFDGLNAGSYFERQLTAANAKRNATEKFCKSMEALAKKLGELTGNENSRLFIFVDELDRCPPTYSIQMLERIQHLFDCNGVSFIIGTDSNELAHSINAVYGSSFGSHRYLNRFFSYTYELNKPDSSHYIDWLYSDLAFDFKNFVTPGMSTPSETISLILTKVAQNPREQRQILFLIRTVSSLWRFPCKIEAAYLTFLAILVFRNQSTSILSGAPSSPIGKDYQTTLNELYYADTHQTSDQRIETPFYDYLSSLYQMRNATLRETMHEFGQKETFIGHHISSLISAQFNNRRHILRGMNKPLWSEYEVFLRSASKLHEGTPL